MSMDFAAVHESVVGTSRRFVATHRLGAIRGIAEMPGALRTARCDAIDPKRTFRLYDLPLFAPSFIATGPFARQLAKLSRVIMFDASILVSNEPVDCTKRQDGCRKREKLR